jgi:hypothetical protein
VSVDSQIESTAFATSSPVLKPCISGDVESMIRKVSELIAC